MAAPVYTVRAEIFELVLPLQLPTSFTLSSLLKIPTSASSTTHISFAEWSMAAMSLGLTVQTAQALFDAFVPFCLTVLQQLDLTREEVAVRQNTAQHLASWQRDQKVPLPPFLLFLFCQQFRKQDQQPETWAASNPQARENALRVKCKEDHAKRVTAYVNQHLYHLLALLALNTYRLTFQQLDELRLLIRSTEKGSEKEIPFAGSLPFWKGVDRGQPQDITKLQDFISANLSSDSRVYPSVLDSVYERNFKPSVLWPGMPQAALSRYSIIRGHQKNLIHKFASDLSTQVQVVFLATNQHSNIYLLAPLRNVVIMGCTNCNIVLGAVSGVVSIEHCEKVRVICCTRSIRISETVDARIYTCCNTSPLIGQGNRNVNFAPYNTFYPTLEAHLEAAGVNPRLNLWNDFVKLGRQAEAFPLPVHLFTSVATPFTNHPGNTNTNPCTMPSDYHHELKRKAALASKACAGLRAASASGDSKKEEMAKVLTERFQGWLQTSGNLRHVLELLHYHEEQ
eukprot:Sspe_Gene.106071::Locus_83260_Transcript_1_1_Confidence_1.000_Length_1694::g.106071::m.106071/K16810/TBCCD1; TBCC domain-containing protein 1